MHTGHKTYRYEDDETAKNVADRFNGVKHKEKIKVLT